MKIGLCILTYIIAFSPVIIIFMKSYKNKHNLPNVKELIELSGVYVHIHTSKNIKTIGYRDIDKIKIENMQDELNVVRAKVTFILKRDIYKKDYVVYIKDNKSSIAEVLFNIKRKNSDIVII